MTDGYGMDGNMTLQDAYAVVRLAGHSCDVSELLSATKKDHHYTCVSLQVAARSELMVRNLSGIVKWGVALSPKDIKSVLASCIL